VRTSHVAAESKRTGLVTSEGDPPTIHDQQFPFAGRRRLPSRYHKVFARCPFSEKIRPTSQGLLPRLRPPHGLPARCLPPSHSIISSTSPYHLDKLHRACLGGIEGLIVPTKCGIRNVSMSLTDTTDIISLFRLCRICERTVPLRYESNWRLHCAFCRPGHVRFYQCPLIGWELMADRSSFFQWHDILQVIIPRTSAMAFASSRGESVSQEEGFTTCPICLAPPTAPRMTKCGHVRVSTYLGPSLV